MTAVSSQKRGERKTNRRKAKGRGRMKGRGWRESVIVSLYIFSFSFHLHPILQHQTLTPLPRVGKSTDSIFSPPCCWDSETSLQLNADKRVVDSNIQNILLFLFFFLSPQQCAVFLISFTYKGLNIYKLALYMSWSHQIQILTHRLFCFRQYDSIYCKAQLSKPYHLCKR